MRGGGGEGGGGEGGGDEGGGDGGGGDGKRGRWEARRGEARRGEATRCGAMHTASGKSSKAIVDVHVRSTSILRLPPIVQLNLSAPTSSIEMTLPFSSVGRTSARVSFAPAL